MRATIDMHRPHTALQAVLQHAEDVRDAALADLTRCTDAVNRLRAQQDQLVTYRRDYHLRWTTQFRHAGGAEVVQHYQSFVDRLNHALSHLKQQLEQAEQQATQAREQLIERETRVLAVRKLIERRAADQAQREASREQRLTDELAARMAWQRPAVAAL